MSGRTCEPCCAKGTEPGGLCMSSGEGIGSCVQCLKSVKERESKMFVPVSYHKERQQKNAILLKEVNLTNFQAIILIKFSLEI